MVWPRPSGTGQGKSKQAFNTDFTEKKIKPRITQRILNYSEIARRTLSMLRGPSLCKSVA